MKRLLNLFRDEGQEKKGWLFLKGKHLALDKQKHVLLGMVIFLGSWYFFGSETAFIITFFVALAWEIQNMFGLIGKRSMFNVFDIIATCLIPAIIQFVIVNL